MQQEMEEIAVWYAAREQKLNSMNFQIQRLQDLQGNLTLMRVRRLNLIV